MYSRVNYTLVGIFVLLFAAGAVLFSFWLAKYGLHQEYRLYKTYLRESVAGLSEDSVVKLNGVDIGRVKSIRIDPSDIRRVEVLLSIEKGVPIKSDMVAHTTMLGVTGLLSIEIEGGSNEARTLHPTENHIPVIKSVPSWQNRIKNDMLSLSGKLDALLEKSSLLLSAHNLQRIEEILDHTAALTRKGVSLADEANATLAIFREKMQTLDLKVAHLSESARKIADETLPLIRKLHQTTDHFDRVTLQVEKSLRRGDYNLQKIFEPMLVEIEILTDQIGTLTRELERSPSDLLFKSRRTIPGPGEKR